MKKCVSPVRKAPTAMRKQPMAMSLGRCSLAPKWLTTARNNKLPTSGKKKKKKRAEEREKKNIQRIVSSTVELKSWETQKKDLIGCTNDSG